MSNLNEVFFKEEVICPLINTPEGSEELVAISQKIITPLILVSGE